MTKPETATNEDLIHRVIDAQVKGGYRTWAHIPESGAYREGRTHTLAILLDTQGLKAAYGDEGGLKEGMWEPHWSGVGHAILRSWNRQPYGSDIRAALETAVSLLPSTNDKA